MAQRTPEEIRQSIEHHRGELAVSLEKLRGEVQHATDWRGALARNRKNAMIGAAVAGFVLAGGVAAVGSVFRRR